MLFRISLELTDDLKWNITLNEKCVYNYLILYQVPVNLRTFDLYIFQANH